MFPSAVGTADCVGSGCDTAFGSFGGVCAGCVPAGTYIMGSINFDTSGTLAGLHDMLNFLRTGIDGVNNKDFVAQPVQLNGAILNVVPEPAPPRCSASGCWASARSRGAVAECTGRIEGALAHCLAEIFDFRQRPDTREPQGCGKAQLGVGR